MIRAADIFGIREAAAFLGVHEQTIRRLARRGAIPGFKVGRDWRFRKEALVCWSEAQQPGDGQCSVIVVDDDERLCRGLARMLEGFGCRVRRATDGELGLQLLHQETPDLMILDLVMPDMNGVQVLEELRRTHPALPVVVVTGFPDGELMQEASRYAPVMVLAKPVEAQLLMRTVQVVVGRRIEDRGA